MTIQPVPVLYLLPQFICSGLARGVRLVATCLLASVLIACKVSITVPEGGRVVSEDGFECLGGQTCEIDVSDTGFDSTFTAIADEGYTFTRWLNRKRSFCANLTAPCYLSTTNFGSKPKLLDVLAGDMVFYLEPVFVNYDVPYWTRTLREIDLGTNSSDAFLYAKLPNVSNCDPGALKEPARTRALDALNQNRSLHGLPAVTYDNFYDMQEQEASLVQLANQYLNHFPAPTDRCYSESAKEGASSSNISLSSITTDPASDVFGWTNDNNNVGALMEAGHRRWNLFPELGYTSYGKVGGASALKVLGFARQPQTAVPAELEFVAVPYKSYPYILVSPEPRPTPWSLSMVPAPGGSSSFRYFASASVRVTDGQTDESMPVTDLHTDSKGAGLANFLSWMVGHWQYDRKYQVTVSNISMPDGSTRDISYPVTVDRYNLADLEYPREAGDTKRERTLQGNFNTARDRDSYTVSLAGNVTVSGRGGSGGFGFFVLIYDTNKRLVRSSDAPFSKRFALGRYTVVLSPCDENGLCYVTARSYRISFN